MTRSHRLFCTATATGQCQCGVDCYEHSYYLNFQNRKANYVDGFAAHIDWEVVERRFHACSN